MEKKSKRELNTEKSIIKVGLVVVISLLLLIPLAMVRGVIGERESTKDTVTKEVSESYAAAQTVYAPRLESTMLVKLATDSTDMVTERRIAKCEKLDYKAEVATDVLHRSIYDVIVYNSKIDVCGSFCVTGEMLRALNNRFKFDLSDFKGLTNQPQLSFGGNTYSITRQNDELVAAVKLPKGVKDGDTLEFVVSLDVKGTESLYFTPNATETTLSISSKYPNPSFQGTFLPEYREVRADGFDATWKVLDLNINYDYSTMGVKFVQLANPYQQAMRSAKYGMLIIALVFVAGLFVEFLTKKNINPIQYAVIGLSLVLFYSLLLAFSEFVTFGLSYVIAASMTTSALMLYFRGILKSRSAYLLGGFVALVYALNYMLLQMETYALLAGSLVLFLLLCVVMYLTTNINKGVVQDE